MSCAFLRHRRHKRHRQLRPLSLARGTRQNGSWHTGLAVVKMTFCNAVLLSKRKFQNVRLHSVK